MGTRADFYVGRDTKAEWLGSIGWDGYPDGIPDALLEAKTEQEFRDAVAVLSERKDWTAPEMGWPWPWDNSNTTDYAYAFDASKVHGSCFGGKWFDPTIESSDDGDYTLTDGAPDFPDMSARKAMTMGPRSGLIVVSG